uniref:Candidate secreted effector n=1 Tax=Meloidogyne incognita TaxID=6306 RepID=A0A914LMW8_MELIC
MVRSKDVRVMDSRRGEVGNESCKRRSGEVGGKERRAVGGNERLMRISMRIIGGKKRIAVGGMEYFYCTILDMLSSIQQK